MCMKTHYYIMEQKQSLLRKYGIFEVLIFEIYHLLKSSSPNLMNSTQILKKLSPFLQEKLASLIVSQKENSKFFHTKEEIITYIVHLLVENISLIQINTQGYYYIQVND